MKNRNYGIEALADVHPLDETPIRPGEYVPFDLALMYLNGLPKM